MLLPPKREIIVRCDMSAWQRALYAFAVFTLYCRAVLLLLFCCCYCCGLVPQRAFSSLRLFFLFCLSNDILLWSVLPPCCCSCLCSGDMFMNLTVCVCSYCFCSRLAKQTNSSQAKMMQLRKACHRTCSQQTTMTDARTAAREMLQLSARTGSDAGCVRVLCYVVRFFLFCYCLVITDLYVCGMNMYLCVCMLP